MEKRKGLSPLIATVLLIAFTIAIGVMISRFAGNYTKSSLKTSQKAGNSVVECSLQDIEIDHVSFDPATGTLKVLVTNTGTENVTITGILAMDRAYNICHASNKTLILPTGGAIAITGKCTNLNAIYKVKVSTTCPSVSDEWTNSTQ